MDILELSPQPEPSSAPLPPLFRFLMDRKAQANQGAPSVDMEAVKILARAVSGPELAERQYLDWIEQELVLDPDPTRNRNHANALAELWLGTGALLECPKQRRRAPYIVFKDPARWMDTLPGDPNWHLATSPVAFLGDSRGTYHPWGWERFFFPGLKDRWTSFLANSKDEQTPHAQELRRVGEALARKTIEAGRLNTLKSHPNGVAWLFQCLAGGTMEAVEEALAIGIRLDKASEESTLAFFEAMMGWQNTRADEFLSANHRCTLPKNKAARAHYERLVDEDHADLWNRWALAIQAGLPMFDKDAVPEERRKIWIERGHWRPCSALAVFAQEALRDGRFGPTMRILWLRAATENSWRTPISREARALPGESPMQWALRHGFEAAALTRDDMIRALSRVYDEDLGSVLTVLAESGAKLSGEDKSENGLVAMVMGAHADPQAAAQALLQMDVDFAWLSPDEEHFASVLFREKVAKNTPACQAALAAAEIWRPGLARKIIRHPSPNGETAAHLAVMNLNIPGLEVCLAAGADINAQDAKGRTLLHWAARKYGQKAQERLLPVIAWLQVNGYDWALTNAKGETGLAELAKKGPVEAVEQALKMTPEWLAQKDADGKTPLDHLLARGGHARALGESLSMAIELKNARALNAASASEEDARDTDGKGKSSGSIAESGHSARKSRRL